MPDIGSLQDQAETFEAQSRAFDSLGRAEDALDALHNAVLLFAAADTARENTDEPGPLTRPRADACRLYGDSLATLGRHAEAANIYQEATDLYGLIGDPDARKSAGDSARRLLQSVAALRADPRERLHLLVAHYERSQEQLALEPGTEFRQAERRIHIARIYQRRDRPADSAASYREALGLLEKCDDSSETDLTRAECQHRIATLLAEPLGQPHEAVPHYQSAIGLYQPHEPFVHGFQQSLELCRAGLDRARAAESKQDHGRDRERSRE